MNYEELARLLQNLIRLGTVSEVQYANPPRVRVKTGALETNWLVWVERRAGTTTTWNPPTVGEQVVLLSPGGDLTGAIVLSGVNSDDIAPPSDDPNTHVVQYPDGATYAYDHVAGRLIVTGVKSLVVDCQDAVINSANTLLINCPENTVNGKLTVKDTLTYQNGMTGSDGASGSTVITGNIVHKQGSYTHSGGELSSNGVVLDKHTHGGVLAGGDSTGEPQ